MPTQITQVDDDDRGVTIYRVEGEMFPEDVELITRLALEQRSEKGNSIVIDIADLDFIDSNSAPLLRRLESVHGFEITGSEIFLQNIVNAAEKA
ncbi:MAG: STAS domain-containing protein [Pyrinomonadaceae bacterium]|nr:STAS domain-containing protein [Pyrinomonadaceae bacterium]